MPFTFGIRTLQGQPKVAILNRYILRLVCQLFSVTFTVAHGTV